MNAVYVYDDRIKMFFNVRDSAQITYPEMLALDGFECSDFDLSGVPEKQMISIICFSLYILTRAGPAGSEAAWR